MINQFDPSFEPQKQREELSVCKCGCTWFEQFSVRQLRNTYVATIGQTPPPANDYEFVFLRCLKCKETFQPNITPGRHDQEAKLYYELLDFLDKEETKPEEKK